MALSTALNVANAGLAVTSRRAEVVSTNIANAATAGYARRELSVQSNPFVAGPQILGITRQTNAALTGDRRAAEANAGAADYRAAELLRLEQSFGTVGEGDSLTDTIDALDAALITAAASSDSTANLSSVAEAARAVARKFEEASDMIQDVRADADARIASDVETLNTTLASIADLDDRIVAARAANRDTASLEDQRQSLVDDVANIIPLREVAKSDGRSALVALNGAVLLDGRPAEFGFTKATVVSADSTTALSGLTLNGQSISTGQGSLIDGGTLAAAFTLRDDITTDLQTGLDELAYDIANRLAEADDTLTTGLPGLLTDAGAAVDSANIVGLSSRLSLNSLADEDDGGDVRYIRDGFGSTSAGPVGDGSLLLSLQSALADADPRSAADRATDLVEALATQRVTAETDATRAQARASILIEEEAAIGVNSDQEIQDLLQIEKAYAANAKVLQVVDGLLQTLLEI